jgi:hypothetical protein
MTSPTLYSSCGLKFAFDIHSNHVLNYFNYFGFEDAFSMIKAFLENNNLSEDTYFHGTDGSCAKFTVVFESHCDAKDYETVYNETIKLLDSLNDNPPYNKNEDFFNIMLESLNEDDDNPVIFVGDPDSKVWTLFNKQAHGFETHIQAINDK